MPTRAKIFLSCPSDKKDDSAQLNKPNGWDDCRAQNEFGLCRAPAGSLRSYARAADQGRVPSWVNSITLRRRPGPGCAR